MNIQKLKAQINIRQVVLGLGALFVLVVGWAIATMPDVPTEAERIEAAKKIMTYTNHTIKAEENGKVVWEVTAGTTSLDMKTQDAQCTDIKGIFHMKSGLIINATAPAGAYNGVTKEVQLSGGAVVTTSDGDRLTADEIHWSQAEEKVTAQGKAHAEHQDMTIDGDKLEAWDDFEMFKSEGNVRITRNPAQK